MNGKCGHSDRSRFGSRLPRMSMNATNSAQRSSTDSSSIPRPMRSSLIGNTTKSGNICDNKQQNNCNSGVNCDKDNAIKKSSDVNALSQSVIGVGLKCANNAKSLYLCKSQSLNEIQYESNNYLTRVNNLVNGVDAVKAFSSEHLDESVATFHSLAKDVNSENNLMEMSIDESSTASLGLLPNVLCASFSPLETLIATIPNQTIKSDIKCEFNVKPVNTYNDYCREQLNANIDVDDDDSENGIPVIQEEECCAGISRTREQSFEYERPVTPLMITNALDLSDNLAESLDITMTSVESEIDTTVVDQQVVVEFETMNLDNSSVCKLNESVCANTQHKESITSEKYIPIVDNCCPIELKKENIEQTKELVSQINAIKSSNSEDKLIANNNVNVKNKVINSSAVRPNSLITKARTTVSCIDANVKVQRAVSPSSKTSLRKKIKTPGRWDAVMNKIEISKTNQIQKTTTIAKARMANMNASRGGQQIGLPPKMSPLSDVALDNDSSHLSPLSTLSSKSRTSSFSMKKTTLADAIPKASIPKSKTFVRESTANTANNITATTAGNNKSQQPVPQPTISQTSKKDMKGVTSIIDKKTARRPVCNSVVNSVSFASKRVPINKTTPLVSKKDSRSPQISDDKKQIQALTELCEYKTKQLKTFNLDQNYMRLAFDSLSVVIRHLTEQFEAFENPKLKQALRNANKRCEQLKDSLDRKNLEINDLKIIFEEQINQLMKEREKISSDLNEAKINHEENVKKLLEMHSCKVNALEEKHSREMQLCQQTRQKLLNDIDIKSNELELVKQSKDLLEAKVHQMEENIMKDKDKKFKYLTEKTKQLELEVDSLRAVMDMKNEKIHKLESEMTETREKMNDLPFAKETIRSLQQQIENLQVTLERKISQFNQLLREHEDLKNELDREMREKRRLSMKNEELQYHLSESFHNDLSIIGNNYDLTGINSVSAQYTDETPIKPSNRAFTPMCSTKKTHSKAIPLMANSSAKRTPALYCKSSFATESESEDSYLMNGSYDDSVFESSVSHKCNSLKESKFAQNINEKSVSVSGRAVKAAETPPQCILDSGFEDIQGLNSLSNNK